MLNTEALFSDETESYKQPYEPDAGDNVTLKLRTLKGDVLKAYAVINGRKRVMKKFATQGAFDYYKTEFICGEKTVRYYFVVSDEDDIKFVNRLGATDENAKQYHFSFVPGFKVPDWSKGAVYYQIFPDRFCNGNPKNDVQNNEYFYTSGHVKKIEAWDKFPDALDVNNFYGGDLQGVMRKLDYLQRLGVEVIYFNPLFVSPSNHKYDTQDYDYIDPHLAVIEEDCNHEMQFWEKHNGFAPKYIKRTVSKKNLEASNLYFAEMVEEIHRRGMRVVVDGVFNHCGSFNKWLDREGVYLNKDNYALGAWQSLESPYRKYFRFKHPSEVKSSYEGWWNFETLPKLDYENCGELEEYILSTGAKWVSAPYFADGWRLDVAADLGHSLKYNHIFWQKFRERVRKANPDAVIFAEHYGSPESWFNGKEWDTVMNYDAFMEPVTWFLTGMEKHSRVFDESRLGDGKRFFADMAENMSKFPRPSLDSALNQLSNHDHSRFLTRTNRTEGTTATRGPDAAGYGINKNIMRLAVLVQFTWVGSPGIYYGDEAGQVGWTDPDSRRTYPWGKEDNSLINYHRAVAELRKEINCLKLGSIKPLCAGNGYIVYGRFNETDCAVIAVNCSDGEISLNIPVWELGVPCEGVNLEMVFSSVAGEYSDSQNFEVRHGRILVTLKAESGFVLYYNYN